MKSVRFKNIIKLKKFANKYNSRYNYKGILPKESEKILTVAGSRTMSEHGKRVVNKVVLSFSKNGYSILNWGVSIMCVWVFEKGLELILEWN